MKYIEIKIPLIFRKILENRIRFSESGNYPEYSIIYSNPTGMIAFR